MVIISWLNRQLLKMEWLFELIRLLVENVFGLNIDDRLGGSIHFFIYDVIKIFILLSVLILPFHIFKVISRLKEQRKY